MADKHRLRCGHKGSQRCTCQYCYYCDFIILGEPRGRAKRMTTGEALAALPAITAQIASEMEPLRAHMREAHPLSERVNDRIWRWLTSPNYGVLHRVIEQTWNSDDHEDDEDMWAVRNCVGRTACGREGRWIIPGIFSRMGAPRCKRCCARVGVPPGDGTPWNDRELPDEVQAR